MKPLIHRSPIIMSPLNPGKAISIDDFIESEVENYNASDFLSLRDHVDALRSKMQAEQAQIHFDLQQGVELLIPDYIPEIGLTNDARILARVLERNPELR